ncbi:hypothetical protein OUZ56_026034 [Daphnia magna]|uniref:Uncharacterized protein n=1 Tax=Daphnia magna TaxID=35525 RepID=A0ABQ9ZLZ0_9CRUS|nr:hypothetical protein OUZ56_026034 [Daphnia magna]
MADRDIAGLQESCYPHSAREQVINAYPHCFTNAPWGFKISFCGLKPCLFRDKLGRQQQLLSKNSKDLLGIRSLIVQVSCLGKAFVCSNRILTWLVAENVKGNTPTLGYTLSIPKQMLFQQRYCSIFQLDPLEKTFCEWNLVIR